MTSPVHAAHIDALLAKLGFSTRAGDALVVVERRPAAVLWASAEALSRFGAADPSKLGDKLFRGGSAAAAFAARLARLSDTTSFRLERVSLAADAAPMVIACHPLDDEARSLAVLHLRGSTAATASLPPPAQLSSPEGTRVQPVTRILWEADAAGVVMRIGPEARLLGASAPKAGDDLPAVLREAAPALSERIAAAARDGGSVGLVRFSWPVGSAAESLMVDAGCTGLRGTARGLRGFFAVHGSLEAPGASEAPDADQGGPGPTPPDGEQLPAPEAESAPAPALPDPEVVPLEQAPPLPSSTPSGSGAPGNIVHFPVMRLGPVPANFVPALRPAPALGPAMPDAGDLVVPQWSEAPRAEAADQDGGGLSASERDAFEHIRKVLGTRPFAAAADAAPPPAAAGLPPGVPQLLDRVPVGLRLDAMGTAYANAMLRDRLGAEAAAALPDRTEAGSRRLFARDGTPVAAEVVPFDMAGTPATLTILPAEGAAPAPDPEAAAPIPEVLDLVTDGHLRLDEAGAVSVLSPRAARLLGIEAGEALGRPFASFLFEGQAPSWQALVAAATGPEAQPQGPSALRLRTGAGQPVAVMVRLGRSGGGFVCALTLDRPAAVPANDTAEVARREAERTSALKSEFLAKVSHEIRTPLNAILGFAEVIRDERLGPVGNARYLEYMRDIHASGTHVMSLVNDLLDLSRIEAGRMDLNLEAVDANGVVQACVNTLQTEAHRERVIVRLSLTPRLPPTLADERSLRQIVLNLLSNAIKFNEPGGQVIVSTALSAPDAVAIRIRDTGIGMSDDEIAAAMEPFRQLSTVNRTGSGLGLPLTKALVEANCASMAVKSTRGEGTLVEVTFPVVEAESVSLPAE